MDQNQFALQYSVLWARFVSTHTVQSVRHIVQFVLNFLTQRLNFVIGNILGDGNRFAKFNDHAAERFRQNGPIPCLGKGDHPVTGTGHGYK